MPSRGGQPLLASVVGDYLLFQFVPSRGGQLVPFSLNMAARPFQFVPSRGGQPPFSVVVVFSELFQFVPSRGGQPGLWCRKALFFCFNSCPHAEGNHFAVCLLNRVGVSIRALTRRATLAFCFARGVMRFQFVPSRGGQPEAFALLFEFEGVSIRALTRRATSGL